MDEDAPHQMRWPRVVARVAGYMILVVVLHALSVGPVGYLLVHRSPRLHRAFHLFYAPYFWVDVRSRPFDRLVLPYNFWWFELPGGPFERIERGQTVPAHE